MATNQLLRLADIDARRADMAAVRDALARCGVPADEMAALADPDATGCAPVGTGGTGRVLRFPVRLRVAPAAVALPMLRPDADEAAAIVERVRAGCRFDDMPCGNCALCAWSRDDQATYCAWDAAKHRPEDCGGFDADRFDMLAWHRIHADVCHLQPREVA